MNEHTKYAANIKYYTAYRFFWCMLIIGPVLTPYMRYKGLNYSEIMLLQSIAAVSVVLFEIPTGTVADRISRKLSLLFSGAFIGIGLLIYIQFHTFAMFALGEFLFGLGLTFGSGADSALLYESLKKLGREEEYTRIEGRVAAYIFGGQGVGSVVSSLLYTLNPDLPFWVSVVNAFIAAGITLGFLETNREKSDHRYHIHVFRSLNIALKTPRILWAILLAMLMGFAARSGFWLYEPYFRRVSIDVAWYGTVFLFFNIIAALSAKYLAHRYPKPRKVLLGLGLILAVSFVLPAVFVVPWAVVLIGLQQIVRGMYRPTLNAYINRQIEDRYRATVISIVSLSASLSFALLSPVVGLSLDHLGTIHTYTWMGTVTLGGILLLMLLRKVQVLHQQARAA